MTTQHPYFGNTPKTALFLFLFQRHPYLSSLSLPHPFSFSSLSLNLIFSLCIVAVIRLSLSGYHCCTHLSPSPLLSVSLLYSCWFSPLSLIFLAQFSLHELPPPRIHVLSPHTFFLVVRGQFCLSKPTHKPLVRFLASCFVFSFP